MEKKGQVVMNQIKNRENKHMREKKKVAFDSLVNTEITKKKVYNNASFFFLKI
jgi:hypothetical protein